jgi:cob(I)alamin adenosyltransferase
MSTFYIAGKTKAELSYNQDTSVFILRTVNDNGATMTFSYVNNFVHVKKDGPIILAYTATDEFAQCIFMESAQDAIKLIERASELLIKYSR